MERVVRNAVKALIIKDDIKISDGNEEWYIIPGGIAESYYKEIP